MLKHPPMNEMSKIIDMYMGKLLKNAYKKSAKTSYQYEIHIQFALAKFWQ
jgi:hypothetical protein